MARRRTKAAARRSKGCAHYLVDSEGRIHGRGASSKSALKGRAKKLAKKGIRTSITQLCGTDRRRAVRRGGLGSVSDDARRFGFRPSGDGKVGWLERTIGDRTYVVTSEEGGDPGIPSAGERVIVGAYEWTGDRDELMDNMSGGQYKNFDYFEDVVAAMQAVDTGAFRGGLRGVLAGGRGSARDARRCTAKGCDSPRVNALWCDYHAKYYGKIQPERERHDEDYRDEWDALEDEPLRGLGSPSARAGRTVEEEWYLLQRKPTAELERFVRTRDPRTFLMRQHAQSEITRRRENQRRGFEPEAFMDMPKSGRDPLAMERARTRPIHEQVVVDGLRMGSIPTAEDRRRYAAGARRRRR